MRLSTPTSSSVLPRVASVALLATLPLALAGCATPAEPAPGAAAELQAPAESGSQLPGANATALADTVWGTPNAPGTPYIEFRGDHDFVASDSCNTLGGQWRLAGGSVIFDEFASTEAYCDPADAWLAGLASAAVAGTTITFSDAEGTVIGSLEQVAPVAAG